MKKLSIFCVSVSFMFMILFSSDAKAYTYTITSLVGDMDNFGTDSPVGKNISYTDFTNFQRDYDDGNMDMDRCLWCRQNLFSWGHDFDISDEELIISATLTIATFDLEDGGAGDGLGGKPYDTLLFLDSFEVAGAFDDVFSADGFPIMPNTTFFELPSEFLRLLADGSLDVLMNSHGGERQDCIAIDYAILEIEVSSTPEPATILLLSSGIIGFAGFRRKYMQTNNT